jgi:hypothetical protein
MRKRLSGDAITDLANQINRDMVKARMSDEAIIDLAFEIGRMFDGVRLDDVLVILATLTSFTLESNFDTAEARQRAFRRMQDFVFMDDTEIGGGDANTNGKG